MAMTTDPVCGMHVEPDTMLEASHDGHAYRFCSVRCRDRFLADPARYAGAEHASVLGSHDRVALERQAHSVRRFTFPAAVAGFSAIALFFLLSEHRAHSLGVLPFLLLLACPVLHLLLHRGHRHQH